LGHKSLIKILNNGSAEVEPSGTLDSMGKGEEGFLKMEQWKFYMINNFGTT
jgi:hypothetical protein